MSLKPWKNPTTTILGIVPTKQNKFLAHHGVFSRIIPNTRVFDVQCRSTKFLHESIKTLDFWTIDSDFIFCEDVIPVNHLLGSSGNSYDYFGPILKVFRVMHSLFEKDSVITNSWTRNSIHNMDVYHSLLMAEVVLISPVLKEIFDRKLKELFSKNVREKIEQKYLILPPPDLYKLDQVKTDRVFSNKGGLRFLWNHRFVEVKNHKLFFALVAEFKAKYKVPVTVVVLSSESESWIKAKFPKELQKDIEIHAFTDDHKAYAAILDSCNITLGTSLVESYGIAILEAVMRNIPVLNFKCNEAFTEIVGPETTFETKEEIVDSIHKVWTKQSYRTSVIEYNKKGLQKSRGTRAEYTDEIVARLSEVLRQRLKKVTGKSPKIATVLKAIDKKPRTKKQVYELMGWQAKDVCQNKFWPDYYYGLRKHGIEAEFKDGQVWFHWQGQKIPEIGNQTAPGKEKIASTRGLFSN